MFGNCRVRTVLWYTYDSQHPRFRQAVHIDTLLCVTVAVGPWPRIRQQRRYDGTARGKGYSIRTWSPGTHAILNVAGANSAQCWLKTRDETVARDEHRTWHRVVHACSYAEQRPTLS